MSGSSTSRADRGNRKRRPLGLLVVLVMLASLAIPVTTASAGIGASGTGAQLSTNAPDLRTATIQSVPSRIVRYCFDQNVSDFSGDQAAFRLAGYNDVIEVQGSSLTGASNGDPLCLDVEFPGGGLQDISEYTIASVDGGVIENASGSLTNPVGAVGLTGSLPGSGGIAPKTTGPDLTTASKAVNDIIYTFDEKLDPTFPCATGSFGFWNTNGTQGPFSAVSCIYDPTQPNQVRVTFPVGDTANAVRFFAYAGAVRDRGDGTGDNDFNPIGSTTTEPCSGTDCTAELTSASRVSDTIVAFTFERGAAGTTCNFNNFFVYAEDDEPHAASNCTVESSTAATTVVHATFMGGTPTTGYEPHELSVAGVMTGALTGATTNTDGAVTYGASKEGLGFTDAPDLEAAAFGAGDSVTFDFDGDVDMVLDETRLCVIDTSATINCVNAGGAPTISDDKVTKTFGAVPFANAVGAVVLDDAVEDEKNPAGNRSHQAAVGRGPAVPPPSAGTIGFSSSTYSVNEQNGTATISVTRSGGSSGAASVNYSTSNGSAGPSDYSDVSNTLTWAAGESGTKSFNVPIFDDLLAEGTETVNLQLSFVSGASLGLSSATLSILDNDVSGSLSFSSSNYSVGEAAGAATITVNRLGGSSGTVSVNYSTSNGTATAGQDYTSSNGTLFFGNGVTSQTFTVPITQDLLVEGNETVNLALAGAGGGGSVGSPSTAVLTIVDDDLAGAGVIALASNAHTVGESDGSQTISVIRTGGTTGTVTAQYATSPGTATATDFQSVTGTVTFLAGETTKTFLVPILNDNVNEGAESFTVTLSSPGGGATLGTPSTGSVTITDDDVAPPGSVISEVSIRYKHRTNRFKGRVTAPTAPTQAMKNVCMSDREVVLRTLNGRFRGSDVTGVEGRWTIFRTATNNNGYYAVVKATGLRTLPDGSQVSCTRAESSVIFP